MSASSTPDLSAPLGRRKRDESAADDVSASLKRRPPPSREALQIRQNMRQEPFIVHMRGLDEPSRLAILNLRYLLALILEPLGEYCSGSLQQCLSIEESRRTVVDQHLDELRVLVSKAVDDEEVWDDVCSLRTSFARLFGPHTRALNCLIPSRRSDGCRPESF